MGGKGWVLGVGDFTSSVPPAQQVGPCWQETEDKGVKSSQGGI